MFEDELIPLFEKCGSIWDLRLMMDPMTGTNRGYAFVTFTGREAAQNAVKEVTLLGFNWEEIFFLIFPFVFISIIWLLKALMIFAIVHSYNLDVNFDFGD